MRIMRIAAFIRTGAAILALLAAVVLVNFDVGAAHAAEALGAPAHVTVSAGAGCKLARCTRTRRQPARRQRSVEAVAHAHAARAI